MEKKTIMEKTIKDSCFKGVFNFVEQQLLPDINHRLHQARQCPVYSHKYFSSLSQKEQVEDIQPTSLSHSLSIKTLSVQTNNTKLVDFVKL